LGWSGPDTEESLGKGLLGKKRRGYSFSAIPSCKQPMEKEGILGDNVKKNRNREGSERGLEITKGYLGAARVWSSMRPRRGYKQFQYGS